MGTANYFATGMTGSRKRREMAKAYHYREDWRMKCPYYRKESTAEIRCAGVIGTHTTNSFANGNDKRYHKDNFCNSVYMGCPLYQALAEEG